MAYGGKSLEGVRDRLRGFGELDRLLRGELTGISSLRAAGLNVVRRGGEKGRAGVHFAHRRYRREKVVRSTTSGCMVACGSGLARPAVLSAFAALRRVLQLDSS